MSEVDLRTRVRMSDSLRRTGYAVPSRYRHSPPVVIWQTARCGTRRRSCRLLRVFRRPDGWLVLGDAFRVSRVDWLRRTGLDASADDIAAGRVVVQGMRRVRWVDRDLPLEADLWERVRFEVGCDHGTVIRPLSDLASDCRDVLAGVALPVVRRITST